MPDAVGTEFLRVSRRELAQKLDKIEKAVAKLDPDQIWSRAHENENSIGNLLLHLAGNVRQWIISGVGDRQDRRDRAAEFAQRNAIPLDELLVKLSATLQEADKTLAELDPARLTEVCTVQGYQVTRLQAIYHCVEHFGGHTGQILWAVKHVTGEDLGFYRYLEKEGAARSSKEP